MPDDFIREQIENWVSDFITSDAASEFSGGTREFAPETLVAFLSAACDVRGVAADDIEEPDVKHALLRVAASNLPASVKRELPVLCGAFLSKLEDDGRLAGGRLLGAFARALNPTVQERAAGKPKPITRPGSRIGRNDPCPCGSGKKYKKCCMGDA